MDGAAKENLSQKEIQVTGLTVPCDGDSGKSLGHPRVYLTLAGKTHVDCPYCGRRYVLKPGAKPDGH